MKQYFPFFLKKALFILAGGLVSMMGIGYPLAAWLMGRFPPFHPLLLAFLVEGVFLILGAGIVFTLLLHRK